MRVAAKKVLTGESLVMRIFNRENAVGIGWHRLASLGSGRGPGRPRSGTGRLII
jgi:hypothetical protein